MQEAEIEKRTTEIYAELNAEEFKTRPRFFDESALKRWAAENPELAARYAALHSEREALRLKAGELERVATERKWRLERLRDCGLGEREIGWLVQPHATEALKKAREWLASECDFLLLSGGAGTGKTIASANALADHLDVERQRDGGIRWMTERERPCGALFVRASEGQRLGLFDEESQAMVKRMRRVALLVFDDMGTEMLTDVWRQQLDDVIDSRYSNKLRTIITTNLTPQVFKERYGERIADRIRHTAMIVQVGNESMRKRPPPT